MGIIVRLSVAEKKTKNYFLNPQTNTLMQENIMLPFQIKYQILSLQLFPFPAGQNQREIACLNMGQNMEIEPQIIEQQNILNQMQRGIEQLNAMKHNLLIALLIQEVYISFLL